jgi:hypothetical protein
MIRPKSSAAVKFNNVTVPVSRSISTSAMCAPAQQVKFVGS